MRGWPQLDSRLVLGVILAVAACIRLGAIAATGDYEPVFDSADYERHATSIAAGDGFPESVFAADGGPSAFRPPIYPYVLGAVYALAGDGAGETWGRILGALIGVVVVYLTYLLGRMAWDRRVGLLAAGIAAVAPPLALVNAALISEPLFLALVLGVLICALAARRGGGDWRWAALAGVLCGAAALTRSNGILLLIPAIIGVWAARPALSRSGLVAPVAVVAAAALAIVPWTVRNAIEFDSLVPISTQSGFAVAGAYNDEARDRPGYPATWVLPQNTERYGALYDRSGLDEAELDRELRSSALEYMRESPGFVAETTTRNTLRTLELMSYPDSSRVADERQLGLGSRAARAVKWTYIALAILAAIGVVALLRRPRDRRGPWFIWLAPVLMVLAATWVIASTRYRIPAYPFLILLSSIAVIDVRAWLAGWRRRRTAPDPTPSG